MITRILTILLNLSFACSSVLADTIYQWSDPWGQIQYSKTPVPGAMISDLTELPEMTETTEQQKREAMVNKLQQIKQQNLHRDQNAAVQRNSNMQTLAAKNNCRQLQIIMADLQAYNYWQYPLQYPILGVPLFPGHNSQLQYNLAQEIRNKCR